MSLHMLGSEWFSARPGGLNRYFEALWGALGRASGTTVAAAAFGAPPEGGASLGPVTLTLPNRLRACRDWSRQISDGSLVDYHFALYARTALRGSTTSGSIAHFHGPWASESVVGGDPRLKVWAKKRVELALLRHVARVVVLSRQFADVLCTQYGMAADRIEVIPGGVDVDRFLPVIGSAPGKQVVAVRRLEDRMGLDVLLQAWPRVLQRHADATLLIIGDGTARPRLEALVASLGVSNSVRLVGRQSDDYVVSAYQRSAVSVVPSIALEGFGLIALESLACGTPPVVTRCGGLPGVVEPLDARLVVEVGDPIGLAEAIASTLDGHAPAAGECRSYAERYSWDRVAHDHLDLYASLS
jgi:glycosyltransferase involved in cell wall biosynthesis